MDFFEDFVEQCSKKGIEIFLLVGDSNVEEECHGYKISLFDGEVSFNYDFCSTVKINGLFNYKLSEKEQSLIDGIIREKSLFSYSDDDIDAMEADYQAVKNRIADRNFSYND